MLQVQGDIYRLVAGWLVVAIPHSYTTLLMPSTDSIAYDVVAGLRNAY